MGRRRLEYLDDRWRLSFIKAELGQREKLLLATELRRLQAEDVPLPGDVHLGIPPVMMEVPIYSHLVPQTQFLRIKYEICEDSIILMQIMWKQYYAFDQRN